MATAYLIIGMKVDEHTTNSGEPLFSVASAAIETVPTYGLKDGVNYVVAQTMEDSETTPADQLLLEYVINTPQFAYVAGFFQSPLRIPWLAVGWLGRDGSDTLTWFEDKPEFDTDNQQWLPGSAGGEYMEIKTDALSGAIVLPPALAETSVWRVNE